MDWKQSKCGQCEYWIPGDRPRQVAKGHNGVLMDGPRPGECHEHLTAIGMLVQTPQGPALRTDGIWAPCTDTTPACARFVKSLSLIEA